MNRVVILGDSYGEPGSPLSRALPGVVVAAGVRGQQTRTLAREVTAQASIIGPGDYVLVITGANDAGAAPPDAFAVIDHVCKANGAARVTFLPPPSAPLGSPIVGRGAAAYASMVAAGVDCIPSLSGVQLGADETHPTPSGAAVLAAAVIRRWQATSRMLAAAVVLALVALVVLS